MKHQRTAQELDTSSPAVAEFIRACGLAKHAVSIRLLGIDREDLQVQIDRMSQTFGALLVFTRIQPTRDQRGYVAYGTFLG